MPLERSTTVNTTHNTSNHSHLTDLSGTLQKRIEASGKMVIDFHRLWCVMCEETVLNGTKFGS